MVCPERVLNLSSSIIYNSPKIAVVFFGNRERSKESHGPSLLDVRPLLLFVRRAWKALPQPNIITSRVLFIFIPSVNGMFKPVSPKNHHPLPEMTSIDNSSAAKFLALFCIPALLLASGSFDVASSVIV